MRNQNHTIISKGKYAHRQPAQLIHLKQYIFAREQRNTGKSTKKIGGKKQLLLRFVNERNEVCNSFSFVLYQLDAKGTVIKEDRYESSAPRKAGESFVLDTPMYVEERCTDFRIRMIQASFGDYTYHVENAGILVSYDKEKELVRDVAADKKSQPQRIVQPRTIKKQWMCVAVALIVLATAFLVCSFLLFDFIEGRNSFSLSGVKYEFVSEGEEVIGVRITGYSGRTGSLLLPSEIDGYEVVGIEDSAFAGNRRVRRVRIEELKIPLSAFENCYNLEEIQLEGVTEIGERAFFNCDNLRIVRLKGVERIGTYAFGGCSGLRQLSVSHEDPNKQLVLGAYAFAECQALSEVSIDQWIIYPTEQNIFFGDVSMRKLHLRNFAYTIEGVENPTNQKGTLVSLFHTNVATDMTQLSEVSIDYVDEIPENFCTDFFALQTLSINKSEIKVISESAFRNCYSLNSVKLPKPVTAVQDLAFFNTALTSIDLSQVTYIGESAFEGCIALESIGIDAKTPVREIGKGAFMDCAALKEVYIPLGVSMLNDATFMGCTSLQEVTFAPNSVISKIPLSAFEECASLQTIALPATVTVIDGRAFSGCKSLVSIVATGGITHYGYRAFGDCSALAVVPMSEGLIEIGAYAFSGAGLQNVVVPESVQKVGFAAFEKCEKLSSFTLSFLGETPTVAQKNFAYIFGASSASQGEVVPVSLKTITLRGEYTELPAYAFFGCVGVETFNLSDQITSLGEYAFSGCAALAEYDLTNITSLGMGALSGTGLQSVVIPEAIKYLEGSMFENCAALTSITLHEGVTRLGDSVFAGCTSLESVALPAALSNIPRNMFKGCTSFTGTQLPNGISTIGQGAFQDCTALTAVELPISVSAIENDAFAGSGLSSMVIPKSVIEIGGGIFTGCASLSEITIPFVGDFSNSNNAYLGHFFGVSNSEIPASLKKVTVDGQNGGAINVGAFASCIFLEEVILRDGVMTIDTGAFNGCFKLNFLSLPATLQYISYQYTTFNSCYRLFEIENLSQLSITNHGSGIAQYALEIRTASGARSLRVNAGDYTFARYSDRWYLVNCNEQLTELKLPSNAAYEGNTFKWSIPAYLFYQRKDLTSLTVSSAVTSIGRYAFAGTGIATLSLETAISLISIEAGAFAEIPVRTLSFANSLSSLGNNAFYYCPSLNVVKLPASLQTIGDSAFAGCYSLYDVYYAGSQFKLKAGDTSYGHVARYAVAVHRNMLDAPSTELKLLNDTLVLRTWNHQGLLLSYNGNDATLNIEKLSPDITSLRIAEQAFRHNNTLKKVVIGAEVEQIQQLAFYACAELREVVITSQRISEIEGYTFENCRKLRNVTLSDSITSIGVAAFRSCTLLQSVHMPSNLQTIGRSCFDSCYKLLSITIPASVTSINDNAFNQCVQLFEVYNLSSTLVIKKGSLANGGVAQHAKVVLTSANQQGLQREIKDNFLFVKADNAWYLYNYLGETAQSILTVPDVGSNVTVLLAAFADLQLDAMVIPTSIKKLESNALYNVSGLSTVYYKGTDKQWASITGTTEMYVSLYYYSPCIHEDGNWWKYDSNGAVSLERCNLKWGVIDTPAGCEEEGVEKGVCECGCPYYETRSIPATGHVYENNKCTGCGQQMPGTSKEEENP